MVGRERELSLAGEFLDSARERLSVLAFEGEAGIGKTTVWRETVRLAAERGFRVLVCRPAEAEAKLTFSALADVLEPVPDEAFEVLSDVRRRALEIAVLRADPGTTGVDRRTVGAAVRSLLAELAGAGPVLVAVDDVQWLDASSAATLEFALRRSWAGAIGFLVSRRAREPSALKLSDLAEPARLTRVTVGPLSLAALHNLLRDQLGEAPARSTLVRIHEAAGGNPLFALEVGRVLAETGVPPAGEPLPVPTDVRELVRRRISKLPPATREALLAAAALAAPREDVIGAVLGRPVATDLEPAELQQIAALERGAVVFAHPLFAGAVYGSATSAERRAMHRRLADALDDPEAQARHLALAAEGRDEEAAAVAHVAAGQAASRGAPAAAAELVELALRLTQPGSEAEPQRIPRRGEVLAHGGRDGACAPRTSRPLWPSSADKSSPTRSTSKRGRSVTPGSATRRCSSMLGSRSNRRTWRSRCSNGSVTVPSPEYWAVLSLCGFTRAESSGAGSTAI